MQRSQSKRSQPEVSQRRKRNGIFTEREGYQFDSDHSDEEETPQVVPPVSQKRKHTQASPSRTGGRGQTKPAPSRQNNSTAQRAAVEDTLIVANTQNEKGHTKNKLNSKSRTQRERG